MQDLGKNYPDLGDQGSGFPRPLETLTTGKCADDPEITDYRESVASIMRVQGRYTDAARYLECGQVTRAYCPQCGFRELRTSAHRCGLRECPHCSGVEAKRIFVELMRVVKKIPAFPGWTWRHLVITSVRNRETPIREDYLRLKIGIRRLRRYFRRREFASRISAVGGCQFGPANAMAHVHLAIFCKWLNLDEISRVTGLGTCNVRVIKTAAQFYEAVRYTANFTKSRDPCFLANMGLALKKTRRVFTWGALYNRATKQKKARAAKNCPCCQTRMRWEYVRDRISDDQKLGLSPVWDTG